MSEFGQMTDVGRVRDHNEDRVLCLPDRGLWLVADGMGGYASGEVASAVVVEEVPKLLENGLDIEEALRETHRRIHQAVAQGLGGVGMGSTAVVLQHRGRSYEIAWVGDSRAYLWDGSSLKRLTRDHSLVQQLLDSGAITEDIAQRHPQRNVITQALGSAQAEIRVDTVRGNSLPGDRFLLCSDGLTSELSDREIAAILSGQGTCQTLAERLIEAANGRGGRDNISVLLIEVAGEAATMPATDRTRPMGQDGVPDENQKRPSKGFYRLAVLLSAAALLLLWLLFHHHGIRPPGGE